MSTNLHRESRTELLTMAMIRDQYLPLGERTIYRMISTGQFPKADRAIGGKIRLWRRTTIENWMAGNSDPGE